MNIAYTLDLLPINKVAEIVSLKSKGIQRRRMLDLGLVSGTYIKTLQKSPSSDPVAYLIKGTVIALRKEDAKNILINYRGE